MGEFRCKGWELFSFNSIAMNLLREFDDVQAQRVPRVYNEKANNLALIGPDTKIKIDVIEKMVII